MKRVSRYDDEQEMYESCDITIEMIDSGYWEIFSKDKKLIDRFAAKFKDTQLLDTDFLTREGTEGTWANPN